VSRSNNLSVAVIELTGGDNLRAAVDHLQKADVAMEILVVCRTKAPMQLQSDGVQVIEDAGHTVPARRLTAMRAARSHWVVLLEDTTLPTVDWFATIPGLLADPNAGGFWGPIQLDMNLPARFKALWAMEYGRYSTSATGANTMPGNCMALRRTEALKALNQNGPGIVEHVLVPRLSTAGWPVQFNAALTSVYAQKDPHGARLSTRFAHGRLYGANRYGRDNRLANFKGTLRALFVPLVLSLRAARYLTKQLPLVQTPSALIWIALMSVAWGAGEFFGHLFGEGQSRESWT